MSIQSIQLTGKGNIYFAGDFHLGAPDRESSEKREALLVDWLTEIAPIANAIVLMGDLFDFWFEYKYVVPKGYYLLISTIKQLVKNGITVIILRGNHDLWLTDYLPSATGCQLYSGPIMLVSGETHFYLTHGDGIAKKEQKQKMFSWLFKNSTAQWLFSWLHPTIAFYLAQTWSAKSRDKCEIDEFMGADDDYVVHCRKVAEQLTYPIDYFIFGHRHLQVSWKIDERSHYINLSDWIKNPNYGVWDGSQLTIKNLTQ